MPKTITLQEDAENMKAAGQMYFSELYQLLYRVTGLPRRETLCGVERTVIAEAVYSGKSRSFHKREMGFDDCKKDRRATPKEKEMFDAIEKEYSETEKNQDLLRRQEREKRLERKV